MEMKPEKFLGEITPAGGRWSWPYGKMQKGDWFTVSAALRSPHSMRNMSHVRGSQLGKRFSISTEASPGYIVVECLGTPDEAGEILGRQRIDYGVVQDSIVPQHYPTLADTEFDGGGWVYWNSFAQPGHNQFYPAQCVGNPGQRRHVVHFGFGGGWTAGIELLDEGIKATMLPRHVHTVDQWKQWEDECLADVLS